MESARTGEVVNTVVGKVHTRNDCCLKNQLDQVGNLNGNNMHALVADERRR